MNHQIFFFFFSQQKSSFLHKNDDLGVETCIPMKMAHSNIHAKILVGNYSLTSESLIKDSLMKLFLNVIIYI